MVCQSLGLKIELQFWTVALHYVMMGDDYATSVVPPLDSCYDVVCDCATYRVSFRIFLVFFFCLINKTS